MDSLIGNFIFFFAVIDPIGTIPVFIAVTHHYHKSERSAIAFKAAGVSALVLIFFMIAGELILTTIKIPLSAFQVGGGVVLFLFALSMIFGESKPEEEVKMVEGASETAIFPLAIPSIAGPGAMLGAVLLTEKDRYQLWEQALTALTMLSVVAITLVFMLFASYLYKFIGKSGASIISRVMGIILSAVASSSILEGVKHYFSL